MTIAVLGATGQIGRPTVESLLARSADVRAIVRDPQRGAALGSVPGASLHVEVDTFTDPATLAPLLRGTDVAFLVMGATGQQGQAERVVLDAVGRAVVPDLVRISVLGASPDSAGINQRAHYALDTLAAGATRLTALRPAIFDSYLLNAASQVGMPRGWVGSSHTGVNPLIAPGDVVACAVEVLTTPALRGNSYDLTGPELFSWPKAAGLMGELLGLAVPYTALDDDTLREVMLSRGIQLPRVDQLVARDHATDAGEHQRLTDWVRQLTGHVPGTLAGYIRDNAAELTRRVRQAA